MGRQLPESKSPPPFLNVSFSSAMVETYFARIMLPLVRILTVPCFDELFFSANCSQVLNIIIFKEKREEREEQIQRPFGNIEEWFAGVELPPTAILVLGSKRFAVNYP